MITFRNGNKTCKLLISNTSAIAMFEFRTVFFPDTETAKQYLKSIGYYQN